MTKLTDVQDQRTSGHCRVPMGEKTENCNSVLVANTCFDLDEMQGRVDRSVYCGFNCWFNCILLTLYGLTMDSILLRICSLVNSGKIPVIMRFLLLCDQAMYKRAPSIGCIMKLVLEGNENDCFLRKFALWPPYLQVKGILGHLSVGVEHIAESTVVAREQHHEAQFDHETGNGHKGQQFLLCPVNRNVSDEDLRIEEGHWEEGNIRLEETASHSGCNLT